MLEKYEKAGKIASKVRKQAAKKATAGMKVSELVSFVENSILKTGAGLSFPCNISINEITAHYTSSLSDDTLLCNGDIVKIDLGAEVDGYISDTAVTVIIEGDNKEPFDEDGNPLKMPGRLDNGNPIVTEEEIEIRREIIEASSTALENVISILKAGVTLNDIGKVVKETMTQKGYTPIVELAGHSLQRYTLHAGLSIPNYPDGNMHRLKEGDHVAIEPFATNGIGLIDDLPQYCIYLNTNNQYPLRQPDARKLLNHIRSKHEFFPFSKNQLVSIFNGDENRVNRAMRSLLQTQLIYPFNVLKEHANGMVAQTEHTFIIEKEGCEITTL